MTICNQEFCTGCGMCTNICPKQAISMEKGLHDFLYPNINKSLCCECGVCQNVCPANDTVETIENVNSVYAAWNKDKTVRAYSTSGGVFTLLSEKIISDGGLVAGVKWTEDFHAEHCLINNSYNLRLLNGSKYVQSNTANIYMQVKQALDQGLKVLFSGTPCQNHALKNYLGKAYDNLFQVDLICHGVPSYEMFSRYLCERKGASKEVSDIRFRYKLSQWDYPCVKIDFTDGTSYEKYTVDDTYYTIFNIGYSLRDCCRRCKYTSTHRYGDITLADFWGFSPRNLKMRDYLKGTSLILVNSEKGNELLGNIKNALTIELSTLNKAISGNQSLKKPCSPPQESVSSFWIDYENGTTVDALCKKHVTHPFAIPKHLWLRRFYHKYKWMFKL